MGSAQLLPRRTELVRGAQPVSADTLRLCATERDAFLVSKTLSRLTYAEIAARIGVRQQAVSKWLDKGVPSVRVTAFCNATGTTLLRDFLARERAYKAIQGQQREADRIAHIASYSQGRVA